MKKNFYIFWKKFILISVRFPVLNRILYVNVYNGTKRKERTMKKILSICLSAIFLAGCMTLKVSAQETVYPKVFHTYTSTDDMAKDEWTAAAKGAYLMDGISIIVREDNTHVSIGGNTDATQKCDKIHLSLYLERSKSYDKGYGTYKEYTYDAVNAYTISKEISNIPIERGYYYRVKGVHIVKHNGVTETTDSVTDPIDFR